MKSSSRYHLKIVPILLASATLTLAQTSGYSNNQNVPSPESVRPGSLNYVEGQVSSGGRTLDPQAIGHFALQSGQSLATGDGYAEVLLTPGAFLRVGPDSEFRMASVGLADTQINLTRGSALVETDQLIAGTHLEVTIGNTSADLLKKGLYEFSASAQNVRVFDGKLNVISLSKSREIGKGDQLALAAGDGLKKTSFDLSQAKTSDKLYVWSEARSRDESARNQLVAQNPNGYTSVGAGWFWDPYANYYGFWPSAYLYSPFGFGFYGGYYPGFYGGNYGGYRRPFTYGRFAGGTHAYSGVHGNGIGGAGFHGGLGGGGFHAAGGGGGHR